MPHRVRFRPTANFLAYTSREAKTGGDIWILPEPLGKASALKPFSFLQTAFNESFLRFSPDGKWVAYQSDQSGRNEIYVASFPDHGTVRQISTGGGVRPRWNPNGKELFFITGS
jgi:Tol biopolymer transport system component